MRAFHDHSFVDVEKPDGEQTGKRRNDDENKERWREVEASLKKAGDELGNAFKAAFKKKENPK